MARVLGPIDWSSIDLVVFDLDGTLYDQGRLRRQMMLEISCACVRARSVDLALTLRQYRRCREDLGDHPVEDFTTVQYTKTAKTRRRPIAEVERIVAEWMEARPLAFLPKCRYPGVRRLFQSLREAQIIIAVFSDYPATAKLEALDLDADFIVAANDEDVRRLKPDPTGLHKILARSGASAKRSLMIGDRPDRDGAAARLAGVRALIRSPRAIPTFDTFKSYDDPIFRSLFVRRGTGSG